MEYILTKSQLKIIVEQSIGAGAKTPINNRFTSEAIVEDDMVMMFPVKSISYKNGKLNMTIYDGTEKKDLYVINFKGPIYDAKTNQKVYTDSFFQNINMNNYKQIAKTNNIPITT